MPEKNKDNLETAIDLIEGSYEYMLAYAAQGRDREAPAGGDGLSIRKFLADLEQGLKTISSALAEKLEALELDQDAQRALGAFNDRLDEDAKAALLALNAVMTVPSISSQIIDNLNASVHLRCLLTDLFVIDEALKIHKRESAGNTSS